MKHRLFAIVAAVSLVLCAASTALWIRSCRVAESVGWTRTVGSIKETPGEHFGVVDEMMQTTTTYTLISRLGGMTLLRERDTRAAEPPGENSFLGPPGDRPFAVERSELGPFVYERVPAQYSGGVFSGSWPPASGTSSATPASQLGFEFAATNDGYQIGIPIWLCVLLTALLPASRAIAFLRCRSPRHSMCSNCGYDLRATPDRCPECGALPIGIKP